MPRILDNFPALYAPLLPEFFQREISEEKRATCSNCAMCASPEGVPPPTAVAFHRDTKCCTRHPTLPNYVIGALLSDERPELAEGRRRVEALIDRRVGVWPTGLRSSNRYRFLAQGMDRKAFGRTPSLRCPYYNAEAGGTCSIWEYRPAVCATYFCKLVAGEQGQGLWSGLKEYMEDAERQLSCYATEKLQPTYLLLSQGAGKGKLTAEDVEEQPPPEAEYTAAWGRWVGREREYYKACYEAVRALSPQEFEGVLGHKGTRRMLKVRQGYAYANYKGLTESLRFNTSTTARMMPNGQVAVSAYDEHDALVMSPEMFSSLTEFTGEETLAAVQQRLREQGRPVPEGDLLLELSYHLVLMPA